MGELVKKTSAAVAVTDELTTLIDWVNIEQVSGFTLIVKNAGGTDVAFHGCSLQTTIPELTKQVEERLYRYV